LVNGLERPEAARDLLGGHIFTRILIGLSC